MSVPRLHATFNILSVCGDRLLAGSRHEYPVFLHFALNGAQEGSLSFPDEGKLADAQWLSTDIIIIATDSKVLVISLPSRNITSRMMIQLESLSISNDGSIVGTNRDLGIAISKDKGATWTWPPRWQKSGWTAFSVISVENAADDERELLQFWALEQNLNSDYRLMMYRQTKASNGTVAVATATRELWHLNADIVNLSVARLVNADLLSRLASDDASNSVFLVDSHNFKLHVFNASSGVNVTASLMPADFFRRRSPCTLALDRERGVLYLGLMNRRVDVFNLVYNTST